MLKETFGKLGRSFVSLLYPPHCLHCNEGLCDPSVLLCSSCASLLHLLDPSVRCRTCFSPELSIETGSCRECQQRQHVLHRIAAAFDYIGPAATIVKNFKYANQPFLAKGIAAFMFAQFAQLDWQMPDVIIPVPLSLSHRLDRGYNQSFLLARELGKLLKVPAIEALKRQSLDYSQAGLSRQQRELLEKGSFKLKRSVCLREKRVLLVDDVYTTGSTLRCSAEALCSAYPSAIYGFTFCRAL